MLTAPGLNERMDWPPQFGYYFLVLTSQRLLQNIARLEESLHRHRPQRHPPQ